MKVYIAGKITGSPNYYEDICCDAGGKEIITLDRLRELAEADRDGRLVVLPCKVGDTVWYAPKWHDEAWDGLIEETSTVNGYTIITFYVDPDMRIEAEIKDFGKTVFLTRAEAEAALEGMQHE